LPAWEAGLSNSSGDDTGILRVPALREEILMPPILCIVGKSDSGKTYLIERLLPEMTQRGYRIATVKHDVHGFEIDREGKDTWRHKQAGASAVVLSSREKIAVIQDLEQECSLDEIRMRWISNADLILTEGYKRSTFPKIEVSLFNPEAELLCRSEDQLVAVVSNRSFSLDVPVFREEEIKPLADLLEKRFLRKKVVRSAEVYIAGKSLALNPFVQEILRKMNRALLSTLKGWDPEGKVEIRLAAEYPGKESNGVVGIDHENRMGKGSPR
jgi:molybdopterin-guanine dinucleotide biosynthesis protein B